MKVLLLFGGNSSENKVSRKSAKSIIQNIDEDIFELTSVYIDYNNKWYLFNDLINIDNNTWIKENLEIKNIIECKKEYEKQYNKKIPVIVAGGIFDSADIAHALELGADGVQIASRFVATEECDASDAYKQAYIHAREEDIQIIQSPVGMPGRALRNEFIKNIERERQPIKKCYNCLAQCNPGTVPYCITQALINAVKGDIENGLIFCGSNVGRIHQMTTVHNLMEELTDFSSLIES